MEEYIFELKIPKERIAVLIGKKGETKKHIEDLTKAKIDVDSAEGEVFIKGQDTIKLFATREIIKAIGRGFNPESALLLLKPEYCFELININDYIKSKSHLDRLRGRVIGSEGRARKNIEELSETSICVYGKTIGIIGETENVAMARRAIDALLTGSTHSSVYKMMEKIRAIKKKREFLE
jgi:ribosomal RNA assembly protein